MKYRRTAAWTILDKVFQKVALQGGTPNSWGDGENAKDLIPTSDFTDDIELWQTFYDRYEVEAIFDVYAKLKREQSGGSHDENSLIEEAFQEHARQYSRSVWKKDALRSHFKKFETLEQIRALGGNDDVSIPDRGHSQFNKELVAHYLRNRETVVACADGDQSCFKEEFPSDAVSIKTVWGALDGNTQVNDFDHRPAAMNAVSKYVGSENKSAWQSNGTVKLTSDFKDKMFTMEAFLGNQPMGLYGVKGIHVMTKELPHWVWISLWWSDNPDQDFGEDRPAWFAEKYPLWSNYKMCVVTWYREEDDLGFPDLSGSPSLQASLRAQHDPGANPDGYTWCSNPYIERADTHSQTNCIGCHQYSGVKPVNSNVFPVQKPYGGRGQELTHFVADYFYSFGSPPTSFKSKLTEAMR